MNYLTRFHHVSDQVRRLPAGAVQAVYLLGDLARAESGSQSQLLVVLDDEPHVLHRMAEHLTHLPHAELGRILARCWFVTAGELAELQTSLPARFGMPLQRDGLLLYGNEVRRNLDLNRDAWSAENRSLALLGAARLLVMLSDNLSQPAFRPGRSWPAEAMSFLRWAVSSHYAGYVSHRDDVTHLSELNWGWHVRQIMGKASPGSVYQSIATVAASVLPGESVSEPSGTAIPTVGTGRLAALVKQAGERFPGSTVPVSILWPWRSEDLCLSARRSPVLSVLCTRTKQDLESVSTAAIGQGTPAPSIVLPSDFLQHLLTLAMPSASAGLHELSRRDSEPDGLAVTADALRAEALRDIAKYRLAWRCEALRLCTFANHRRFGPLLEGALAGTLFMKTGVCAVAPGEAIKELDGALALLRPTARNGMTQAEILDWCASVNRFIGS